MTEKEFKIKKIVKIAIIICFLIIVMEAGLYLYLRNKQEQSVIYYDSYQMFVLDGEDYVAVGSSDFKKSEHNEFTGGVEKGKLIKYDKNGNIVFEVQYSGERASTFTSVVVVEDGYIVTGSGVYDEYQEENNLRDAFLIKYDKNGNKVWEKFYGVLSNTRFNKAIVVEDGIVVIGLSNYENMEVGNHTTGGGIIVKYDFEGNEIWHNNHGGNKSGSFTGVVEVDGDFYVVGKDAIDYGNLIKFDKNGKYLWHKNYSYTDSFGLQDIAYFNNKLYVVGSKKILEDEESEKRQTENIDAVLLVFDKKGNVKEEKTFGGSKLERFTAIQVLNDTLYVSGVSNSKDGELDFEHKNVEEVVSTGFILSYDKNLEVVNSKILGGTNNDMLTEMVLVDERLCLAGHSNSKDGTIAKDANGKDYFGKMIILDKDLNINVIK